MKFFDIFSLKQINKSIITTLIYALNPLIIVSLLINCHNDTYVIFFILLAFYLKKRNKTLLAVLSLTLGTLIKYFPIMFLPYILNKEKSKAKAILYFLMSILIFVGVTFISTGSIKNLTAFLTQAVLYNSSIFVWILTFTNSNFDLVNVLAKIGKIIFVILYLSVLIYFYTMEKKKNVEISRIKKDECLQYTFIYIFIISDNMFAFLVLYLAFYIYSILGFRKRSIKDIRNRKYFYYNCYVQYNNSIVWRWLLLYKIHICFINYLLININLF